MAQRAQLDGKSPGVVAYTVHARFEATAGKEYFQSSEAVRKTGAGHALMTEPGCPLRERFRLLPLPQLWLS